MTFPRSTAELEAAMRACRAFVEAGHEDMGAVCAHDFRDVAKVDPGMW